MRQKVLHVVPSLRYGSAARLAALLASELDRQRFECRLASLTGGGPAEAELAQAGVPVTLLGSRGRIDPRPVWQLRRMLADFVPDVIHAWQPAAVRAVRLARLATGSTPSIPRLIVSRPLSRSCGPLIARLDGWMLQGADRIATTGREEMERCLRLGVPASKLCQVRVGVRLPELAPARDDGRRYIACVGPIESHKGLKDAVWAFDVLHYIFNDLHLLLIGTGPDERRLQAFAQDVGVGHRVHFMGDRADVADLFAMADLVWVPGRSGGVGAILEAMAVGRPVVASRLRESAELLGDGEAGVRVPPNHPAEFARQTRRLLEDKSLCERMGEAGRQRAVRDFDARDMVRDYESLYEEVTQVRTLMLRHAG